MGQGKSSIHCSLSKWPPKSVNWITPMPGATSFSQVSLTGAGTRAVLHFFPRHISRELDQNKNSWDSN